MVKLVWQIIVWVSIIALGIYFAFLNPQQVDFNYYFASNRFPLSLLLVIALAIGFLLGLLCCGLRLLVLHAKIRGLKRALKHNA